MAHAAILLCPDTLSPIQVDSTRLPPLKIVTKEGEARAAAGRNGHGVQERQRTKDERKLGDAPKFDKERAERLLSYREGESP